jgi:hypothetical protein
MATATAPNVEYGPGTTTEIGGSRFAMWNDAVVNPIGWGQQWASTPEAYPTVPPMYGQAGPSGYPASTATSTNVAGAVSNPLHPKASPVIWVVLGLIGGVAALHWLHWRDRGA